MLRHLWRHWQYLDDKQILLSRSVHTYKEVIAMPGSYVYVYAPCTGQNWGQATYCSDGSFHTVVSSLGGCCPIDISGGAGNALIFYGSSIVQSIKTTQVANVCDAHGGWWNEGVKVDFYAQPNAQCW